MTESTKRRYDAATRQITERIAGLSAQDRDRILADVLWDVFGDVDEGGENILVPGRQPDEVDIRSLVDGLNREFFPADEEAEAIAALAAGLDLTPAVLDTVADALGYGVEESDDPQFALELIARRIADHTGESLEAMERDLARRVLDFERAGGRGTIEAEAIDSLRTAIAARKAHSEVPEGGPDAGSS